MIVLGICAALIVAFVNLRDKPAVQFVEGQLLDARFALRGPIATDPAIELVLIDESDVDAASGHLPPAHLREGIAALKRHGAAVIVLDPRLLRQSAPGNKPADDASEKSLAGVLSGGAPVIVPYVFSLTPAASARPALPNSIQQTAYGLFKSRSSSTARRPVEAGGYQAPESALLAAGVPGHITYARQTTVSRQYAYPIIGYGGAYYPSLDVQAFLKAAGLSLADAEVTFGEGIAIGGRYLPTDSRMRLAVNFHGPGGSYRQTRFADLGTAENLKEKFEGKIVILGFVPSARSGAFATPYDPAMSEAEFLANVIDNLKHANPLIRSQQVVVIDILLLALIGLFFGLLAAAKRIVTVVIVSLIATVLVIVANVEAFIIFDLWLGLTFPLLALLLCTAVLVMTKRLSEKREKARRDAEEAMDAGYAAPWMFDRVISRPGPHADERTADEDPYPEEERLPARADEHSPELEIANEPEPSCGAEKIASRAEREVAPEIESEIELETDPEPEPEPEPEVAAEVEPAPEPEPECEPEPEPVAVHDLPSVKEIASPQPAEVAKAPLPAEEEPDIVASSLRAAAQELAESDAGVMAPADEPVSDVRAPAATVADVAPARIVEADPPVIAAAAGADKGLRDEPAGNLRGRKPASLIPVMESSARRDKVTLSPALEPLQFASPDETPVAVLFIAMRNFRIAVKRFGPTRGAQLLYAVYQLIEKTIVRNSGFLEQFGDEDVVGIFGLPEASAQDAENCMRAARELAVALTGWLRRQGLPVDAVEFCITADFGPVHLAADGTAESPDVSLSGTVIGRVSRMDRSIAADGANILVSDSLMQKAGETDGSGELAKDFVGQPMQQIPGVPGLTSLWRANIIDDGQSPA